MLYYEKYDELKNSYVKEFDDDNQKRLFYILEEIPLNIVVLDQEYINDRYQKIKYHVSLTCNMKTLILDFICPESLSIDYLLEDFIFNYEFIKDKSKEDILNDVINEYSIYDGYEITRVIKVYDDIINFVKESKIELNDLIKYFSDNHDY